MEPLSNIEEMREPVELKDISALSSNHNDISCSGDEDFKERLDYCDFKPGEISGDDIDARNNSSSRVFESVDSEFAEVDKEKDLDIYSKYNEASTDSDEVFYSHTKLNRLNQQWQIGEQSPSPKPRCHRLAVPSTPRDFPFSSVSLSSSPTKSPESPLSRLDSTAFLFPNSPQLSPISSPIKAELQPMQLLSPPLHFSTSLHKSPSSPSSFPQRKTGCVSPPKLGCSPLANSYSSVTGISDTSMSLTFPPRRRNRLPPPPSDLIRPESFDVAVKVILLGDFNVGKTSLLHSLSKARDEAGSGCCREYRCGELVELVYSRDDRRAMVRVMDTGGQERYRSLTSSYYRGVHGCLLMFDVTREETFNNIVIWHQDLSKYSTEYVATLLVGSTSHLGNRTVTPERAFKLAESLGIPYMECYPDDDIMTLAIIQRLTEHVIKVGMRRTSFTIEIKPQPVETKKSQVKQVVCLC
ncbi:ras-related protein Rab-44 [Aplysia californica]|uniref:Ras-related protein Rab-44 n=1 Tax=Aplysia californica TaxID=6500 RepID=A0ABM0JVJ2_APLCA|nr:ras-related protein Rab-44 [Aplysia californica]